MIENDIREQCIAVLNRVTGISIHPKDVDIVGCADFVRLQCDVAIIVRVDRPAKHIDDDQDERHEEDSRKEHLLLGQPFVLVLEQVECVGFLGVLFILEIFHRMFVVLTKPLALGTLASRCI